MIEAKLSLKKGVFTMENGWLVLLPPIIVIFYASVTRKITTSLGFGIISAALIVKEFSPVAAFNLIVKRMWEVSELGLLRSWETLLTANYFFICIFLIFFGILIELVTSSGAAFAYGRMIRKKLSNARNVELSTMMMTHLFFVDDYFNSLTVGSVMRPITDQFFIPRIRLGLIINTVAAPLAVIVPVSSWVADLVIQLRQAGVTTAAVDGALVNASSFTLFLSSIPFVFYSFIQIGSLWYFLLRRLSFGILRRHAQEVKKTGNLFGGKMPVIERSKKNYAHERTRLSDFIFPLLLIFISVMLGVYWHGTGMMSLVLCGASLVTVVLTACYYRIRKLIKRRALLRLVYDGIAATGPSVMVLILIWTMSSLLKSDLATGHYLASLLLGKLPLVLLPLMFFVVGGIISTLMGTAWGAIGILVSIALPMLATFIQTDLPVAVEVVPMLMPIIGSLISGALVANHCSPIADIMLMSAASSGSYHLDLIKAQVTFCASGIAVSAFMFFIAGQLITSLGVWLTSSLCIGLGLILNCAILEFLHRTDKG